MSDQVIFQDLRLEAGDAVGLARTPAFALSVVAKLAVFLDKPFELRCGFLIHGVSLAFTMPRV
ncbi:MAG: hypothetical protein U0L51_08950 [Olegusella sp.]|nr:hypothetical protein [Olegusella sp.]